MPPSLPKLLARKQPSFAVATKHLSPSVRVDVRAPARPGHDHEERRYAASARSEHPGRDPRRPSSEASAPTAMRPGLRPSAAKGAEPVNDFRHRGTLSL